MDLWIKITVVVLIAVLVYREILKSVSKPSNHTPSPKSKAGFLSFIGLGSAVSGFMYVGMSMTFIETRDLRPYIQSPQMVSLYDSGVIQLNNMVIKSIWLKMGNSHRLLINSLLGAMEVMGVKSKRCLITSLISRIKPITPAAMPKKLLQPTGEIAMINPICLHPC